MPTLNMEPFRISTESGFNSIQVETSEVMQLFQGKVILHPGIAANQVGAFTAGSIGRSGVINWANLRGPKHLFKPRQNGCTWDPKGMIRIDTERVELAPIEVQLEQCVDALWTEAWEKLLGTGRDIRNIMATPEGAKLMAFMVNRIFDSIRNSNNNLVWWGKNAYIDLATANGWFQVDPAEWADFTEQQDITAGFHTLIASGAATVPHWDIAIDPADVSGGTVDPADVRGILDDLIDGSPIELQTAFDSNPDAIAFYVTPSIFRAYEEYLSTTWNAIPESYYLVLDGAPVRNVLRYKGVAVVSMREWVEFDRIVGVNSHIAYLAFKGVFGIAYDVQSLEERAGIGLDITNWVIDPFKGKTFISTDFKLGMGILDRTLIARAHITVVPGS